MWEFVSGQRGAPDACDGDSGGPAYIFDDSGRRYLVGANSRAVDNGGVLCGAGSVFTLVPAYVPWLLEVSNGLLTLESPDTPEESPDIPEESPDMPEEPPTPNGEEDVDSAAQPASCGVARGGGGGFGSVWMVVLVLLGCARSLRTMAREKRESAL